MPHRVLHSRRFRLLILALALVAACGWTSSSARAAEGDDAYEAGQQAEQRQDFDEAYRHYKEALAADPNNPGFIMAAERTKLHASMAHVVRGHKDWEAGNLEDAAREFEMAVAIDPGNAAAGQALDQVRIEMQALNQGLTIPDERSFPLDALGPPELRPLSRVPINLRMTESSQVILETIGKLVGVNMLFDPDFTEDRITIELNNVTLEEALEQVMVMTTHFWKVLTRNTILVIPDTAVKRREQEQQVIKTFYLSNIITPQELTEVVTAIRTLLETRRIQQINSMNAVIIRDTPDKVALAEKIIRDVDKARAEVVVDVIVVEVRRDATRNLGLGLVSGGAQGLSVPLGFTPGGTTTTDDGTTGAGGTSVTLNRLDNLSSGDWSIVLPGAQLNALLSDSTTKILQRPAIRASDGLQATLRIGDRVPIATGSFGGGVAGTTVSPLVQTQFQYIDVGVNLDITPKVHQNREISLKVRVEISAVTQQVEIGGITQPIIGQRIIEHDIRLREGEANVLGGILQRQTGQTVGGIPGLSQIPILKYLFSNVNNTIAEDEVLIILRPHTVRRLDITPANLRAVDVGTEGNVRLRTPRAMPPEDDSTLTPLPVIPPDNDPESGPGRAPESLPGAPPPPGVDAAAIESAPLDYARLRLPGDMVSFEAGETFDVPVSLLGAEDVVTLSVQAVFDPLMLRLVKASNAGLLGSDGLPVAVVQQGAEEPGQVTLTLTRPPGSKGISGDGAVVNLTFEAVQTGQTSLTVIPLKVGSSQGELLATQGSHAEVLIRDPHPDAKH